MTPEEHKRLEERIDLLERAFEKILFRLQEQNEFNKDMLSTLETIKMFIVQYSHTHTPLESTEFIN